MGETTYAHIRQEFAQRAARGEFRTVDHGGAGQQYTTAAMLRMDPIRVQPTSQQGDGFKLAVQFWTSTAYRLPMFADSR
jgi:hypothetical protein